jgi:hypothetical protein
MPAAGDGPDQLLRVEAAFPDARLRRSEGPAADPPQPSADDAGRDGTRIEELALAHPAYGCNRLEALLALEGKRVSAITVQKILGDRGLGSRYDRWLAQRRTAEQPIELTAEQATFLEKLNPCFRERHVESVAPASCSAPTPSSSAT